MSWSQCASKTFLNVLFVRKTSKANNSEESTKGCPAKPVIVNLRHSSRHLDKFTSPRLWDFEFSRAFLGAVRICRASFSAYLKQMMTDLILSVITRSV